MAMPDEQMAAQGDDQSDSENAQQSGGIVIEIKCLPSGQFTVSSEPMQEEAQEENSEDGSGDEGEQSVNSFGEALKQAMVIYREEMGGASTAQTQFQSGFSKGGM